ncbi:MAG: hypothetical protein KBT68_07020 [bacterium]|nr:hypothetical protein [Candidatus Colisoma equi]
MKIETVIRSVKDLEDSPVARAYRTNPYLEDQNQPAMMVGYDGTRRIGSVGTMPMPLWADGKEYVSAANPDINVDPEYRKTGYALDLVDFTQSSAKDRVSVGFYVSKSARAVVGLYGGAVFDIAQMAVIRDAALFLDEKMPGWKGRVVSFLLNGVFAVHRLLVGAVVALRTAGWRFAKADDPASVEAFVKLIEQDPHRFRPNATVPFYKWILEQDFNGIEESDKHLWKVSDRKGRLIGYVMARREPSGRGRVVDWQVASGHDKDIPWLLMRAAHKCLRSCKAVVLSVCSADGDVVRVLRWLLPPLPLQAATVHPDSDSPLQKHEGWREAKNWRIRPTMGDSCLY